MSIDTNIVIFGGRLVKDPSDLGGKGCKIEVASNRVYKDDGEVKKATTFMPVSCWGKLGEQVMKFCKKGDAVLVEGEIEDRRFTGTDGLEKKIVGIRARDVHFVSTKSTDHTDEPAVRENAVSAENREALNRLLKG
jgi:single-strand DNA-binding protein